MRQQRGRLGISKVVVRANRHARRAWLGITEIEGEFVLREYVSAEDQHRGAAKALGLPDRSTLEVGKRRIWYFSI